MHRHHTLITQITLKRLELTLDALQMALGDIHTKVAGLGDPIPASKPTTHIIKLFLSYSSLVL